jgi:hypothetical protein
LKRAGVALGKFLLRRGAEMLKKRLGEAQVKVEVELLTAAWVFREKTGL